MLLLALKKFTKLQKVQFQIDISIEKNAALNVDGEFTNLSDATKTKPRRKISEKFAEFRSESKKTFKNSLVSIKDYFKTNKYFFYKSWLTFFSIYFIAFTFTMALLPFSYFNTLTGLNIATSLTNFYFYNGSSITLSTAGIAYIVSLILMIAFCVGEIFMYKKYETYKITREMVKSSKTSKTFHIMKYLAWGFLIIGLALMFVLIIVPPPSAATINEYINNQNFVNAIKAQVDSGATVSDADIERLKSLFPGYSFNDQTEIRNFFLDSTVWMPTNLNNLLTFYTMYNGGTSHLNTIGLVIMGLGSSFSILAVICFVVKWMNNFFNTHSANVAWIAKFKDSKLSINKMQATPNLSGVTEKVKDIYSSTQAKYESKKEEIKNRDTFKKYKKRLIQEGKDTNSDNFTTDVKGSEEVSSSSKGFFSVLKAMHEEKKKAQKTKISAEGKVDKNRMKPTKPEIAVPDDELDEIIDSLDIK